MESDPGSLNHCLYLPESVSLAVAPSSEGLLVCLFFMGCVFFSISVQARVCVCACACGTGGPDHASRVGSQWTGVLMEERSGLVCGEVPTLVSWYSWIQAAETCLGPHSWRWEVTVISYGCILCLMSQV